MVCEPERWEREKRKPISLVTVHNNLFKPVHTSESKVLCTMVRVVCAQLPCFPESSRATLPRNTTRSITNLDNIVSATSSQRPSSRRQIRPAKKAITNFPSLIMASPNSFCEPRNDLFTKEQEKGKDTPHRLSYRLSSNITQLQPFKRSTPTPIRKWFGKLWPPPFRRSGWELAAYPKLSPPTASHHS